MLKEVKQNLLDVKSGVICHQTNCLGAMGAGIAKAIKQKWPACFSPYKELCNEYPSHRSILLLGQCQLVPLTETLWLANIFGQHGYGPWVLQTNYRAVRESFERLKKYLDEGHGPSDKQVYVPYKMGCGLAGGDWAQYSPIIEESFPNAIVCRL